VRDVARDDDGLNTETGVQANVGYVKPARPLSRSGEQSVFKHNSDLFDHSNESETRRTLSQSDLSSGDVRNSGVGGSFGEESSGDGSDIPPRLPPKNWMKRLMQGSNGKLSAAPTSLTGSSEERNSYGDSFHAKNTGPSDTFLDVVYADMQNDERKNVSAYDRMLKRSRLLYVSVAAICATLTAVLSIHDALISESIPGDAGQVSSATTTSAPHHLHHEWLCFIAGQGMWRVWGECCGRRRAVEAGVRAARLHDALDARRARVPASLALMHLNIGHGLAHSLSSSLPFCLSIPGSRPPFSPHRTPHPSPSASTGILNLASRVLRMHL
jgi:hypothetical protein